MGVFDLTQLLRTPLPHNKRRTLAKPLAILAVLLALTLSDVSSAQARIFEPQQNWWHSGQTCAATRGPPGRRWRALPPRSCAHAEDEAPAALRVIYHAKKSGRSRQAMA